MNLLIVDFAQFFGAPRAFGHSEEDPFLYEGIWKSHAARLFAQGDSLPQIDRAATAAFWRRFQFSPHITLFYADSGKESVLPRVIRNVREVWLYSPFHSAGYSPDAWERALKTHEVTASNFMLGYFANNANLHHRYPRELPPEHRPAVPIDSLVDDPGVNSPDDVVFDRVFLCKSPAWVPSWCDADWADFIDNAPFKRKIAVDDAKLLRDYDALAAEAHAQSVKELVSQLKVQLDTEAGVVDTTGYSVGEHRHLNPDTRHPATEAVIKDATQ